MDGGLHEEGGVVGKIEADIGGEERANAVDFAADLFGHDDGVIDDDADGEDEGEEGEDVGAVAEDKKQGEGPEDGDGDGGGGDDGGTEVPKKEKDNQNDEKGGLS